MEDIIKIVKSLEDSGLLIKGVTEIVQNEVKELKGGFLSMLLDTLGASLLGNILAEKGAIATSHKKRTSKGAIPTSHKKRINKVAISTSDGRGIIKAGERTTKSTRKGRGIVRAGYGRRSLNSLDF